MRKIITSSVLILLFSLFSGQAFAGKIEVCESIKYDPVYKGLYGLCNAYWNADENAKEKILRNFNKKAGPGGPPMPDPDNPGNVACPCWANGEIDFGIDKLSCQVLDDFAIATYASVQYTVGGVLGSHSCEYFNFEEVFFDLHEDLTDKELGVCAEDLLNRIIEDFNGGDDCI